MDANAIKAIGELANNTRANRTFKPDAEPSHVYYVLDAAGNPQRVVAQKQPRREVYHSIDDLVMRLAEYEGRDAIWYSRHGVAAILTATSEDHPEPDVATIPLRLTPQIVKLIEWERAGKVSLTQTDLILTLRTVFHRCHDVGFASIIKSVKMGRNKEVTQQIQQGKVSVASSMVAEVTGTSSIPETTTFAVSVFDSTAFSSVATITVAIDPDPVNERFNLHVIPGETEAAIASAESNLGLAIVNATTSNEIECPTYYGSPK